MEALKHDRRPMAFLAEQSDGRFIPYCHHVSDTIISLEDGGVMTIFKVDGRTHLSASDQELIRWVRDLSARLRQLGNEHVEIYIHHHHKELEQMPFIKGSGGYFVQRLTSSYQEKFKDTPLMVNDFYLTIIYRPIGDTTQKTLSRFEKLSRQERIEQRHDSMARLEDIAYQLFGMLKSYQPQRLGIYYMDSEGNKEHRFAEDLEADDQADIEEEGEEAYFNSLGTTPKMPTPKGNVHTYSSALEFLGFLLNGEWNQVPVCRSLIKNYLSTSRVVTALWGDVLQVRSEAQNTYMAGVELIDFDDEDTEPGQFNSLLSAPFEFILTHSFICMSQPASKTFYKKALEQLEETKDLSESQQAALRRAADGAASAHFASGWHHCTLFVYADSLKQATQKSRDARNLFASCGVMAGPIGMASEAAYYAMLPGNKTLAPRPAVLTSDNLFSLASFHNVHTGKVTGNPWGPALMTLKTSSGTPFYLNLHSTPRHVDATGKRPNGHTLILGKTGAGKTTLLNMIVAQATKYNPRIFMFDRDRGMQQMVMALGGYYQVINEGLPSGYQPLQLDPTPLNISFVKRLVTTLCEIRLNAKLGSNDRDELSKAVDAVMGEGSYFEKSERTLTAVQAHLPAPIVYGNEATLSSLLAPWCQGGEYGWLFDNPVDELSLDHDIQAFDITDFLVEKGEPAPETRAPMLMYLLFRMRKAVDGSRHVIKVFDEFSTYLDDPIMDVEIKRGLKTDRKRDVVYVFSTQEPNDALDSRIGKTVNQAVATKILLENPEADYNDYVHRMKLTPSEYQEVVNIPEGSRHFLVKQGSMATVASLDLSGMDKEISILSGTPDGADECERIIKRLGTNDPKTWLKTYWRES
ncbi:VirB4 family type IV secretion/conjugal transfer ATPase [Halomonas sp. 3A7M]|uniref:VirB4 family type IV secretion/conjugal transfer ATPase n=1 Tax=Halomonas sp. 3A7M TaxID=2742616 RepID=UPI00186687AB|nr:VirB4 family type IV secretion/conjugal transfer ATPase [Halomonas sp. 3A7M]